MKMSLRGRLREGTDQWVASFTVVMTMRGSTGTFVCVIVSGAAFTVDSKWPNLPAVGAGVAPGCGDTSGGRVPGPHKKPHTIRESPREEELLPLLVASEWQLRSVLPLSFWLIHIGSSIAWASVRIVCLWSETLREPSPVVP